MSTQQFTLRFRVKISNTDISCSSLQGMAEIHLQDVQSMQPIFTVRPEATEDKINLDTIIRRSVHSMNYCQRRKDEQETRRMEVYIGSTIWKLQLLISTEVLAWLQKQALGQLPVAIEDFLNRNGMQLMCNSKSNDLLLMRQSTGRTFSKCANY